MGEFCFSLYFMYFSNFLQWTYLILMIFCFVLFCFKEQHDISWGALETGWGLTLGRGGNLSKPPPSPQLLPWFRACLFSRAALTLCPPSQHRSCLLQSIFPMYKSDHVTGHLKTFRF